MWKILAAVWAGSFVLLVAFYAESEWRRRRKESRHDRSGDAHKPMLDRR